MSQFGFSIVLPTFNRADLLSRTIESVLKQTYSVWELIIVDDGSTDNTEEIVKIYQNDTRVNYHFKKNSGASDSRNFGVSVSRFEWVAFLDSDDYWLSEKLEFFTQSIIHNGKKLYYGEFYENIENPKNLIKVCSRKDKSLLVKNRVAALSNVIMPKEVFIEAGEFDIGFESRQDIDLYVRCSKLVDLYCIDKPTCVIITESNNRISDNVQKRLNGSISFFEKHRMYMTFKERSINAKRIVYFQMISMNLNLKYILLSIPAILFKWN